MSMIRGSFRPEVNKITVPLFMAAGEHDLGAPPEEAPKDYINAASIKFMVLPGAGHNSFAFAAIESLVMRLMIGQVKFCKPCLIAVLHFDV